MNAYLLSVIGAVLIAALINAVLPEGKTAPLIKALSRLICVLAIIAPVLRFFQKMSGGVEELPTFFEESGIEEQEDFITYYSELRIRETEKALEKELLARFEITTEVELVWEGYAYEDLKIIRIIVDCQDCSKEVEEAVSSYLQKNYCSEVKIE